MSYKVNFDDVWDFMISIGYDVNSIKVTEIFIEDNDQQELSAYLKIDEKDSYERLIHNIAKEYDIHLATVSWRCKSKNDKYKNWNIIAK